MKKIFKNIIVRIILSIFVVFFIAIPIVKNFVSIMLGDNYNYVIGYILSGQILIIFLIILFGFLILSKLK